MIVMGSNTCLLRSPCHVQITTRFPPSLSSTVLAPRPTAWGLQGKQ